MRDYRWAILTSLAGLTVLLLGTAVYALQMSPAPTTETITYNELYKQTQREAPLRAPKRGADYLVIVADEAGFMTALTPLLDYRRAQGLETTAVSLAQIAAEFGEGDATPQAIRRFLRYTTENWQPAPRFLLLAGDAALEESPTPQAAPNRNLLPSYSVDGRNADDSWFVTFDENGPGMAVGRFPVQTAEALTAVVNKTIAYETAVSHSPNAAWLNRALLIAGDAPYFDMASKHLENNLDESGYHIHDLHMSQNQDIYTNIVSVLNRGVGILNYTGHGGETGFEDGAAFTADDAHLLENKDRLPVFVAFSCQNGAFSDPYQDSIAEQLLLAENGGIVAAVGASGPTITQHSLSLANTFYHTLLNGNATTWGEVLAQTKTAVIGDEDLETAVHTYNLLGDPALPVHQPPSGQIVRPPLPISGPTLFVNDQ
ncbi:MAG: C25 family cysteine peptidase [Chloroflexota bacterium]